MVIFKKKIHANLQFMKASLMEIFLLTALSHELFW